MANGQRHGQQHGALIAIVGQAADGNFLGCGPGNVAGGYALGQRPLQLGGQAGVARVLPVGVPVGLVDELQAHPHGFAGVYAIGGVRQQLGTHLLGLDYRAD